MQQIKLAIIGSGPSGYTAALYSSRAMLEPVVLAGHKSGGQLMWTTEVENFPGFKEGIMGPDLMVQMRGQAVRFGAQVKDVFVTAVDFSVRPFKLWTALPAGQTPEIFETGTPEDIQAAITATKQLPHDYEAQSVVITTGAVAVMMGVPGEKEMLGRGVSTCAVCDAAFFKDKITYVIGGGDAAMEDTLALTKFAKEVYIIHRRDQFRASKIMQDRVLNHPKVKVLWNTSLLAVMGEGKVQKIKVNQAGVEKEYTADGVFLAIGHRPMTDIFATQLALDEKKYVVTRQSATQVGLDLAQAALDEHGLVKFPTMTSVEGVFAAGDVVDVRYKQAVTAAGQGCSAALDAERWLEMQG